MNKVILIGRLVRNPEVRYGTGANQNAVARYSLAVNRRFQRNGEATADFINCVCFGKTAEFAEKYLKQGTKICIVGRIQTGSYTNKQGQKIYTTDVIVEEHEFVESKNSSSDSNVAYDNAHSGTDFGATSAHSSNSEGFMEVPEGLEDELPFI